MTESLSTDNVEVAMIIAAADLTKHTGMNNADLVVKNYEMIYTAIPRGSSGNWQQTS